jgi:Predicted mannose-6-phosphate isomerase
MSSEVLDNCISQQVSSVVVVHDPERICDTDHGYVRGWGVTEETVGSKHLSMGHGLIPPGASATPHYHPFETSIYIITGTCRVLLGVENDTFVDIKAGDFLYIPSGVVHCPVNCGQEVMEYIVARSSPQEICLYPDQKC